MRAQADTYSFSFTAASLRLNNFLRLAEAMELRADTSTKALTGQREIVGAETEAATKRELQELIKRYEVLTDEQKQLLKTGLFEDRRNLAYLGICKSNAFIRDFVLEVVRERTMVFDFHLEDSDFNTFVRKKSELHPELEAFAESTRGKARQRLWRILEECGLINNIREKAIQQLWVSQDLERVIAHDSPEYFKCYLLGDADIEQLIEKYGKGRYSREV